MSSEHVKWLTQNEKPLEPPPPLSPFQKFSNWLRYCWGIVLVIAIVIIVTVQMLINRLGWFQIQPDYQFAYVGSHHLPEDTQNALEKALASLGEDANGDGQVVVTLHCYVKDDNGSDENAQMASYATDIALMGDISDCESYFFILEDHETFQKSYQVLAEADGTCPADSDFSSKGKVYAWLDCPVLASLELGSYSETLLGQTMFGESKDLVKNLYLGRRCFYGDNTVANQKACETLWSLLIQNASPNK